MNLKRLSLAAGTIGFLCAGSLQAAAPNILFILTDDQGWGDVGVLFQNQRRQANVRSQPWELTPHLDRLATEGAQLRDHYSAAPVCAPSRASILLGVSQGHANVRDNQFDKALENNHTLATVLSQAGYATVAVGKWGLQGGGEGHRSPADWPAYPTKRGFGAYFGYVRHGDGHEHYPKEAPYIKKGGGKEVWSGTNEISAQLDKCYTADLWTAWAKQWVVEHHRTNAAQPFFMYLAYDTPHAVTELPTQAYPEGGGVKGGLQWLGTPGHMINTASGTIDSWIHPDYLHATYDDDHNPATPEVSWPEVYKRYATAVRRVDDAVGDLLKLLQDLGVDQQTLVIFTSDNGPSIESYLPNQPLRADFFASYGPFDGIKRDCWEGGLRVPALARWPGHIPAGNVLTRPSISYDWMRTFAEAAGVPAPARADGVSLLPELTGQGVQQDRGYAYVEYYENGHTPNYTTFAPNHRQRKRAQMQLLRVGKFSGVRYNIQSPADPFEIYDVSTDPKETKNLAAQMPELQRQMQAMVLQVRRPNESAERPYDQALVPAVAAVTTAPGLDWKAYEGQYPWVPDLERLQPVASGTAAQPDLGKRTRDHDIGLLFSGYLNVPQDGDYTFYLKADTGALLRLHDATVIDADYGYTCGEEVSGGMRLKAGLHPFRLYYARTHQGTPALDLAWSGPQSPKGAIPAEAFRRQAAPAAARK